ncbi:MAG: transaldolase, partial [Planctomycetota bacterium]|nr:transaldolase [Planctomycetota bacterium]
PPATNQMVAESNQSFSRQVDILPPDSVLQEIDQLVDFEKMQDVLMREGISKFVAPQKSLLELIAGKRIDADSAP